MKVMHYYLHFGVKKKREKKQEGSCLLHDQQDLCWGESASRVTSEEL